jgi:glycine/D-amino acid oxidase-like deaminating enzyme/nitrite reductase/ring-hydroxylating ferredoxin subunit
MINRDGACVSLWQQHADEFVSTNQASANYYDVAIAGGGITGITTALLLQKAGKKCIVFEAYNLCFGTTGGTTAHLNTLLDSPYTTLIKNFGKDNATLVAQSTKEAIELIRSNIETYNIDCNFEEASAYLFAQTDEQVEELQDIYDACREVHLHPVYANELPLNIPAKKTMILDGQAKFHPVQYVHALAKAFEEAGGVIVQDCRVESVENKDEVIITTSKGKYGASYFIYATHIPTGVNLLHLRCVPYRSYAIAVTLKNEKYPTDLYYDMYDPYHYVRSQKINDKEYLIVGAEDHKTGHIENTDECFKNLEAYIRKHFDVAAIENKWSSQYFEPADALPYIGELPGNNEHILVATGYGGNGMTYSHVAAITLHDIILNKENPYIQLFNPKRIKPVAGFVPFLSHNADVVKQFAGKWLKHESLEKTGELKNGEGKVVKYEHETIALHKDEQGELHAVHPICTHMQCEVKFNRAEQTWDCPCHGARYATDGSVITAPANKSLELVSIKKEVNG